MPLPTVLARLRVPQVYLSPAVPSLSDPRLARLRFERLAARPRTALAWRAVAIRLGIAAIRVERTGGTTGQVQSLRDRADDAHSKADRARIVGLA